MDVHPPKNGINRDWSIAIWWWFSQHVSHVLVEHPHWREPFPLVADVFPQSCPIYGCGKSLMSLPLWLKSTKKISKQARTSTNLLALNVKNANMGWLNKYLWIGSCPHSQHLRPGKHKRSKNNEKSLGNFLKIPMKPLKHPWEIPMKFFQTSGRP